MEDMKNEPAIQNVTDKLDALRSKIGGAVITNISYEMPDDGGMTMNIEVKGGDPGMVRQLHPGMAFPMPDGGVGEALKYSMRESRKMMIPKLMSADQLVAYRLPWNRSGDDIGWWSWSILIGIMVAGVVFAVIGR
jgi:hypothetical protein